MTQRRLGESYSFIHAIDTAQDTRYTSRKIHNAYIHTCAKHRVIEDTFPHRLGRIGCPVRGTRHESCESLGTGLRSIFDRLSSYIQWFCLPILQAICHLLMLIAVEINIDCQVPEGRVGREWGRGGYRLPTHLWLILWSGCCSCLRCWPYFLPLRRKYLPDTKAFSARGFDKLACCLFQTEVR